MNDLILRVAEMYGVDTSTAWGALVGVTFAHNLFGLIAAPLIMAVFATIFFLTLFKTDPDTRDSMDVYCTVLVASGVVALIGLGVTVIVGPNFLAGVLSPEGVTLQQQADKLVPRR